MDKKDFFKLNIEKQISFFNARLQDGRSVRNVCLELNISKSIVTKFKNHGYVLDNNQYVLNNVKTDERTKDTTQSFKRTITVNKELWKDFKIDCIRKEKTASEIVEQLIFNYLKKSNA